MILPDLSFFPIELGLPLVLGGVFAIAAYVWSGRKDREIPYPATLCGCGATPHLHPDDGPDVVATAEEIVRRVSEDGQR